QRLRHRQRARSIAHFGCRCRREKTCQSVDHFSTWRLLRQRGLEDFPCFDMIGCFDKSEGQRKRNPGRLWLFGKSLPIPLDRVKRRTRTHDRISKVNGGLNVVRVTLDRGTVLGDCRSILTLAVVDYAKAEMCHGTV